jgi:predicted amidohydrolase YtcJ
VVAAQREAHARGVTGIHDFERRGGFALWQELAEDRRQTLRVHAAQHAEDLDAVLRTGLRTGFGGDRLTVGPVKAFMDGALGSRTAAMLEPYADGGTGVELLSRAGLEEIVRAASAAGVGVAVHAIGDRANRDALDAFAATRQAWEPAGLRPRIEHAQILSAADVRRFGELGVIASMQPVHATSDRDIADAALGERADLAYAWRALLEAGAELAFGSDAPIEDLDPLAGLRAAVLRTGDGRPPWRPQQAIDGRAALAAYTVGPAQAAGPAGRRSGRLVPGFDADLVVLEGDPTELPPERLGEVRVVATMVAGRWVHGRPPW